jgi:hypothetical protein
VADETRSATDTHIEYESENVKRKYHFGHPETDERIILKLIVNKWNMKAGT